MKNTLYTEDNLFILNGLNSESVDLIYLDPPFNSKRIYSAPIGSKAAGSSFKDMWSWDDVNESYLESLIDKYPSLVRFIQSVQDTHDKPMMAYVTYMTQRIIEMHRVLKNTGSLYLHVDPTASHYLKIVLDRIFGKKNFRNEINWCYNRFSRTAKKSFPSMNDIILFYTKTNNSNFNKIFTQYRDTKRLEKGYHTLVDNGLKKLLVYDENKAVKKIEQAIKENCKIIYTQVKKPVISNIWDDIAIINPMAKERVGYPTQKPLKLLERIIKASSNEGDIVLDPFCGCATTCVKAQQLNRKWIGIDIEKKAVDILIDRLSDDAGMFEDFMHTDKIPQRTDIELVDRTHSVKERLYKQQEGKCNGCRETFKIYNFEVDHIIPKSKGGGDYYENYQLLCGNCNKVKGNRPMEYLRMKIKAREEILNQKLTFGE